MQDDLTIIKELVLLRVDEDSLPKLTSRNDTFQAVINRIVKVAPTLNKLDAASVHNVPVKLDAGDFFITAFHSKKPYADMLPETQIIVFRVLEEADPIIETYRAFVPASENIVKMVRLLPHEYMRSCPMLGSIISGISAELTYFIANTPVLEITDPDEELV